MAEKKYRDTYGNWYNDNANRIIHTGTIVSLTEISQGSADTDRIGDKITCTSLQLCFSFWAPVYNGEATPPELPKYNYIMRVIIFIWKDDSSPTLAEILDDDAGSTSLEQTVLAPLNHDRKVKRKIIMDETYNAYVYQTAVTLTSTYAVSQPVQVYKRFFNLTKLKNGLGTVNFTPGTAGGVNKIFMLMVSNADYEEVTDPINSSWNVFWRSRLNYIDM